MFANLSNIFLKHQLSFVGIMAVITALIQTHVILFLYLNLFEAAGIFKVLSVVSAAAPKWPPQKVESNPKWLPLGGRAKQNASLLTPSEKEILKWNGTTS